MGRPPLGADRFLKELVRMAGNNNLVERPVDMLAIQTGFSRPTVQRYISELSAGGYVKLVYGDHNSIKRLSIEKREMPFSLASPKKYEPESTKEPKPSPVPHKPTPPPAPAVPKPAVNPVPMLQPANDLIVALVDYDNVIGHARTSGFSLSFEKLRELVRSFGRVLFADAYISQINTRPEVIAKLSKAGFRVLTCPQGYKDKDSVDEKIKGDAHQYLQCTPVGKVLIVSRDSDFHDLAGFAADLHKATIFIDVVKEQSKLAGYDEAPQLVQSRSLERFTKALEHLKTDWSGLGAEEERSVRFLKEIIRAVKDKEKRSPGQNTPFKTLHNLLWQENRNRWGNIWNEHDLQKAMTALVGDDVLRRNIGTGQNQQAYQYYTLNNNHQAVIKTFQNPKNH